MRRIDEGLWEVTGSMRNFGADVQLRMTVVRLADGGLLLHSPVALDDSARAAIEAEGPVRAIVAPNNMHTLFLSACIASWPHADVLVARGIPKKLPALAGHRLIEEAPDPPWDGVLRSAVMGGVPFFDECVFLHEATGSMLVTDFVQNYRGVEYTGFAKLLDRLVLGPVGFRDICHAPPLKFRFAVKQPAALLDFVGIVRSWPVQRIVVSHGAVIDDDARAVLDDLCARLAARWRQNG